jgi:hypothetical protein
MNQGRSRVVLIPLGNRIKYRVLGKIFCSQQQDYLPHSRVYDATDMVWLGVFGSHRHIQQFLHRNRSQIKILSLSSLGYSFCDHLQ